MLEYYPDETSMHKNFIRTKILHITRIFWGAAIPEGWESGFTWHEAMAGAYFCLPA
jgi:hypothetical protein